MGSIPQATVATSAIVIGRSPALRITVRPMASRSVVMARLRIMISRDPALRNPPVVVLQRRRGAFQFRKANAERSASGKDPAGFPPA